MRRWLPRCRLECGRRRLHRWWRGAKLPHLRRRRMPQMPPQMRPRWRRLPRRPQAHRRKRPASGMLGCQVRRKRKRRSGIQNQRRSQGINYLFDAWGPLPMVTSALVPGINQAEECRTSGAAEWAVRSQIWVELRNWRGDYYNAVRAGAAYWQRYCCITVASARDFFRALSPPCFRR